MHQSPSLTGIRPMLTIVSASILLTLATTSPWLADTSASHPAGLLMAIPIALLGIGLYCAAQIAAHFTQWPFNNIWKIGLLLMMTTYLLWFVLPGAVGGVSCSDAYCVQQRPLPFHQTWPELPRSTRYDLTIILGFLLPSSAAIASMGALVWWGINRRRVPRLDGALAVLTLLALALSARLAYDVGLWYE